jgi:hypothetical protein
MLFRAKISIPIQCENSFADSADLARKIRRFIYEKKPGALQKPGLFLFQKSV